MATTPEDYQEIHDKYKNAIVIGEQKTSESIDKLWPAFIEAQKQFGEIHKDAEAKVTYKNDPNKSFKFRYATLPNIMDAIRRPLLDQGLWITQSMSAIEKGCAFITTVLRHTSGQFMASRRPIAIPNEKDQKELGIAETYGRRYSLTAFLGIAADDDTDAINTFQQADKVSHRQQRPDGMQRKEIGPPPERNDWQELKSLLKRIGVEDGDKELGKAVIEYCTSGEVTMSGAYNIPEQCKKAVERVADAWREFPATCETPLLSIVKEHIAEKTGA